MIKTKKINTRKTCIEKLGFALALNELKFE